MKTLNPTSENDLREMPVNSFRERSPQIDAKISERLKDVFSRCPHVEIEIGCGKGKFLIERSVQNPNIFFIGIDRVGKWMQRGVKRVDKNQISNIVFFKAHALDLVKAGVRPGSVKAFHVYFPDPWPKRRHHKRRLVTASFLGLLYDRLLRGGTLHVATDHEDYFSFIKNEIVKTGLNWLVHESKNQRLAYAEAGKTNYESKYQAIGRNLFYLDLKKI